MDFSLDESKKIQKIFLGVLTGITIFGIIMVYSSSYFYAKEIFGSSVYFLTRQFLFLIISIIVALTISKTKFSFWIKYGHYIHYFAVSLLLCTFIPDISIEVKGAHRWIEILGIRFQPGELVKFTIIIALLNYFEFFSSFNKKQKTFRILWIMAPLLLLVKQPDFGSFIICFLAIGFVSYLSSIPRKYCYGILTVGLALGTLLMFNKQYRVERILSFLNPWQSPQGSGFQIIQSFLAFANGSLWGQGLGNSKEKLFYLPEAHNDFIFSVVGEEWGFIGVFIIVTLFVILIYTGLKLSLQAKKQVNFLLISSITFLFGIQALLNMGVVLGLLPTKGLNLPFISYGGSSLISNFFGVGLILSASKNHTFSTSPAKNPKRPSIDFPSSASFDTN
ncbi:MAG: putative lipid II flippase FtsW [Halobacteriovoraceae bacterium]|nr:putative lipid II flippase FtsW [Halobacteriovoraceae bacterium]